MIKTYDKEDDGLVKVFFAIENSEVVAIEVGNQAIPVERGFQFYVDDYVAEQIDKCELYLDGFTPKLRVRKGESLIIPTEVEEKQREIEELERKLKELKGKEAEELEEPEE